MLGLSGFFLHIVTTVTQKLELINRNARHFQKYFIRYESIEGGKCCLKSSLLGFLLGSCPVRPSILNMLTILRNSVIYFDKTSSFATRSWQCWENIDLRVPIPLLKEARNLQKNLQDIASMVYIETDDYDFNQLNIKPKPIDLDIDNYKEHDAFFSEIKDTIIQGIRNAKYLIWCAVTWITDDDIYNELLQKRNNGIQIRILTSDEPSNSRLLKNLCDNFEVVKIPQWGENSRNRMHDKFCIIDLEYVMHGSYNWSRNAMSNNETLATALDKDFVKKFADEFMFLYNAHKHD